MSDEKKKQKSIVGRLFTFTMIIIVEGIVALLASNYIQYQEISFSIEGLTEGGYFLGIFGLLFLLTLALMLSKLMNKKSDTTSAKVEEIGKVKKFYDTNWQTEEQLLHNPAYKYSLYSNLPNTKNILHN